MWIEVRSGNLKLALTEPTIWTLLKKVDFHPQQRRTLELTQTRSYSFSSCSFTLKWYWYPGYERFLREAADRTGPSWSKTSNNFSQGPISYKSNSNKWFPLVSIFRYYFWNWLHLRILFKVSAVSTWPKCFSFFTVPL